MTVFERYLTIWVALCIVAGVALGQVMPGVFQAIAAAEIARVNLPVAVLIWLMIVPMLLKIDFGSLSHVREHWRGIGVTLFINWAVKPFSMALLAAFFIGYLFAPLLPQDQITPISPASYSWPPRLARRWCSYGPICATANLTSP